MPSEPSAFLQDQLHLIASFCAELDQHLPGYSYVPLVTDAQRVLVMQSRLFNEIRAAEVFGAWLCSTPTGSLPKSRGLIAGK